MLIITLTITFMIILMHEANLLLLKIN